MNRPSTAAPTAGVHAPQAGPAASAEALRRAGRLAEDLGYANVWISDHVVVPDGVDYPPSAYIYEALTSMTWLAAVTDRIDIGSTVLILSMRNPLITAKALASIDLLSGGRLIVGAAAGWLEAEFDALGVDFANRGQRMDEALEIMQTVWTQDRISTTFPVHGCSLENIRVKPQPQRKIPIWIGGRAKRPLTRATEVADGWHGDFIPAQDVKPYVKFLRERRPEPSFVISMRTNWDGLEDSHDDLLRELEAYLEAGVQHIVAEPRQRDLDSYLKSMERLAEVFVRGGVRMSDQAAADGAP